MTQHAGIWPMYLHVHGCRCNQNIINKHTQQRDGYWYVNNTVKAHMLTCSGEVISNTILCTLIKYNTVYTHQRLITLNVCSTISPSKDNILWSHPQSHKKRISLVSTTPSDACSTVRPSKDNIFSNTVITSTLSQEKCYLGFHHIQWFPPHTPFPILPPIIPSPLSSPFLFFPGISPAGNFWGVAGGRIR